MKRYFQIFIAFILVLLPGLTFAHPGHGEHGGFTITHYFTEPEHVALIMLIVAAIVIYALRRKRA